MFRSNEQQHFSALVGKHIKEQDAPLLLEGGTGLGKTRAYLAALANYEGTVAIVLPTHQLIDQLIDSKDLEAVGLEIAPFRPADMYETRAAYNEHRKHAMDARVMACTAASVIIDQRLRGSYNGSTTRDYLLFDEADQLPQAAALQKDLTITAEDLKEAGVALTTIEETLQLLVDKPKIDSVVRAKAKIIMEAVEEPAWYYQAGKNDDDGIALFHRLPGRLLKRIANQPNTAFISATLSIAKSFNDFRRSLGIDKASRFSDCIEPARHGEITVEVPTDADAVEVITNAERPCLVATSSHDAAMELGEQIPDAIVRSREETTGEAASRVRDDGILIAAGAWAGLDAPLRWASIVIPRIPFERPTVLDEKIESRYIDSKNSATRRMRQVVGRGIRTPDARCAIYILDERYKQIGEFLPERFKGSWYEGDRALDVQLEAERRRCKSIRKHALNHYGTKCHACELVPHHPSQIDIHHLTPIAEGARLTSLDDVIPLCANCHRLAHTKKPPIPINELRELVKQEAAS